MCVRHVLGPRGQRTSYQWLSHSRRRARWCGSEHTGTLTTYGDTYHGSLAMSSYSCRAVYHRRGGTQSPMVGSHRGAYHSDC